MSWKDNFPKENRYFETDNGILYNSNCLEKLKKFPNESVNMFVTSPPYWSLRDYNVDNQVGLEPTFKEYIDKLLTIFLESKRVLRHDGICWVNLGDVYSGSGKGACMMSKSKESWNFKKKPKLKEGLLPKSLCLIPFRFSLGMLDNGWILRNTIIWHKPNAMPSSVKDRFTNDFEYLFFFVKNRKYWFEQQFEPYTSPLNRWGGDKIDCDKLSKWDNGTYQKTYRKRELRPNKLGRNKRTVWKIPTSNFKGNHFAVYPKELILTPIKAGCPGEVCKKCGKAREKIYSKGKILEKRNEERGKYSKNKDILGNNSLRNGFELRELKFEGYTNCNCNAGFESGIVLDPFFGSGTTAIVCEELDRRWIGIELNKDYCETAKKRILGVINKK